MHHILHLINPLNRFYTSRGAVTDSLLMRTDSRLQAINSPLNVERTHLEETLWAAGDPT